MTRSMYLFAVAAAMVLAMGLEAAAQPGPGGPGGGRRPMFRGQGGMSSMYGLPGYYQLGSEQVQKEMELTEDQIETLKSLAEQFREQRQQDYAAIRDLPRDQQREKWQEMAEKYRSQMDQMRQQVEDVLLPHQIDTLKKIQFRQRAPYTLQSSRSLEELGVSEDQKAELEKIRDALQEKLRKAQDEALDKALEVLTDEQRAKLEEMSSGSGFRGFGGRGGDNRRGGGE